MSWRGWYIIYWCGSFHTGKITEVVIWKQPFREETILHTPKSQHEYLSFYRSGLSSSNQPSFALHCLGFTSLENVAAAPGRVRINCESITMVWKGFYAQLPTTVPSSTSYCSALLTMFQPLWLLSLPWMSQTRSESGSLHVLHHFLECSPDLFLWPSSVYSSSFNLKDNVTPSGKFS